MEQPEAAAECHVGTADASKKLLAASPLVQDNQKIVPSITRVFRKDQTMYVYFEVYDPTMDSERKTPNLTAEVELLLGARKVYSSPPLRVSKLATSRPVSRRSLFRFRSPSSRPDNMFPRLM